MADTEPTIETRAEQHYVAIRAEATMQTLMSTLPDLSKAVDEWMRERGVEPSGPPFWRYVVVDMQRRLAVEAGAPTVEAVDAPDGERVISAALPAGRYATLVHTGPPESLPDANAALRSWIENSGEAVDMVERDDGEHWAARIEARLTDPATEPDPTRWRTQLSFKLA